MELVLWLSLFIIFYSYIGYGILLVILVRLKRMVKGRPKFSGEPFEGEVTLMVAAYNEEDFIEEKINNTLGLLYPEEKIKFIFITDGSTDRTPQIVSAYPQIQLLHSNERKGKVAAMHRAMGFVQTPYVIFSDANTTLNKESIKNIMRHYQYKDVGGVAGEKIVTSFSSDDVASGGEGLYWKYESLLKRLDSELYSVVGAAGELFSVRTDLYEDPGANTLLDDFVISLTICKKGYRVVYDPEAMARELPSASLEDEKKRKVRISAGGFQALLKMKELFNIFKYGVLSFQFISHRALRWMVCPFLLPLAFILNILLVCDHATPILQLLLIGQMLFYGAGLLGWLLMKFNYKIKALYAIFYFIFINYTLYLGFFKFIKGRQSVLWEKANRKMV